MVNQELKHNPPFHFISNSTNTFEHIIVNIRVKFESDLTCVYKSVSYGNRHHHFQIMFKSMNRRHTHMQTYTYTQTRKCNGGDTIKPPRTKRIMMIITICFSQNSIKGTRNVSSYGKCFKGARKTCCV